MSNPIIHQFSGLGPSLFGGLIPECAGGLIDNQFDHVLAIVGSRAEQLPR